ncbi:MAG TPA: ATP-binding protein [Bryobacteraceae bacterium]|nr:ATP-binding protein [Bryobacteraceae bacterium]
MGNSGQARTEDEIERLRKALDAEMQHRLELQEQLDRAGAEFEEFVSTAAHNLRESLRDVASFSQLMAENHAGRLDSDAGLCLERIREGAARMQSLLADMVDYSAAGTGGRQSSRTDMEAVLCQALLSTDKQIAGPGATVTHDPLPAVMGDFEILTKVLRHLIRNAVEYGGAPGPRVHLSSKRVDGDWVFSVADNGPGIDLAFQDRIFGVFKRLHGNEHPGSGLGLAFCKKAIEWQGGRMWMESTPGAGSTFYFTLPPAD